MDFTIWQAIAETPWWIYVILAYFIWISWMATRPSVISIKSLFISPILFLLFALPALIYYAHFNLVNCLLSLLTFCLAIPLGWFEFKIHKIKAIKNENKLYIPGTWNLIVIISILCLVKFYFNVTLSDFLTLKIFTYPIISTNLVCLYGFFAGFFIGRYWFAKQCVKTGPFVSEGS